MISVLFRNEKKKDLFYQLSSNGVEDTLRVKPTSGEKQGDGK